MCLAAPGKIVRVAPAGKTDVGPTGTVDFQGSRFEVSLAFTPNVVVGDWVLVHAGFAINRLDEDEAREVWDMLREDERFAEAVPAELRSGPD